jgi:pimeloyl-ACP methyl ester carboxylesterase
VADLALMHVFYLHGFASSARSSKARFLGERLAAAGLPLHCPDFNEPDFSTLTVTRMLDQVDAAIAALPAGPVTLIGSSLGAFVAWHAAARRASSTSNSGNNPHPAGSHPVEKLVLLAPALDFGANRMKELGEDGLAKWKATNRLEFFHYGYGEPRAVHYELYEDARRYDSTRVKVDIPALVFHGRRDALVDPAMVERFCAARPSMTLHMLDDEHQLLAHLDFLWRETAAFLNLPRG